MLHDKIYIDGLSVTSVTTTPENNKLKIEVDLENAGSEIIKSQIIGIDFVQDENTIISVSTVLDELQVGEKKTLNFECDGDASFVVDHLEVYSKTITQIGKSFVLDGVYIYDVEIENTSKNISYVKASVDNTINADLVDKEIIVRLFKADGSVTRTETIISRLNVNETTTINMTIKTESNITNLLFEDVVKEDVNNNEEDKNEDKDKEEIRKEVLEVLQKYLSEEISELQCIITPRHDTSSNWCLNDPTLEFGEYGIEDDTHRVKRGDGETVWSELPYESFGLGSVLSFSASGVEYDNTESQLSITDVQTLLDYILDKLNTIMNKLQEAEATTNRVYKIRGTGSSNTKYPSERAVVEYIASVKEAMKEEIKNEITIADLDLDIPETGEYTLKIVDGILYLVDKDGNIVNKKQKARKLTEEEIRVKDGIGGGEIIN